MTLTDLQTRLAAYQAAELRALESQAYTVGDGATGRSNRRAELEQIRAGIADVQAQISRLQAATSGTRRVMFVR